MAAARRLLIVEDHDALRETLVEVLASAGHSVLAVESAEAAVGLPGCPRFDIAILDLNLPGEDGLSLAARLRRAQPGIGIILLTVRDSVADKVAGYDGGADLYLPKPVAPEELIASVAALARRLVPTPRGSQVQLDPQAGVLRTENGPLRLRESETTLLAALALAPDHRLEFWQLLEVLGRPLEETGKRQLAVIVTRLRAKLEAHGLPSPSIRAERGMGYRLAFPLTID